MDTENGHCHERYEITLQDHDRRLRKLEDRGEKTLDMLADIKIMMVEHISAHKGSHGIWSKVVAYVIVAAIGALFASAGFIFKEIVMTGI